jgi:hypothetical protein
MGDDMKFLQLVLGLGGSLCNYSCPWYRVHKNHIITEKDNTTKFEILLTFDPSPEILIFILSVSGFTERHKIKDLLFILEKINVSESTYREPTVFCDGLPRTYQGLRLGL